MKCLIDGDVLRYEIGFSGEYKNEEGENVIRDFDFVIEVLERRIAEIEDACWATEPSTIFLTCCKTTHEITNKRDKVDLPYTPNFRESVATTKKYKGTRKNAKPFHYKNLTAYLLQHYNCVIASGLEADDLLSVHQRQSEPLTTVICSRDKDLRITPGMHYSWPCGAQPQFGPRPITKEGFLEKVGKKCIGGGLKFFYYQMIIGDTVDNIPGLPKGGPVLGYKTLSELETEEEMFNAVVELYKERIGEGWREYFMEQADLLWMIQEIDNNNPVRYVMYDERN